MHACKPQQPCEACIMHAQRTSHLRADRCTAATHRLHSLRLGNRNTSIKATTSMQSPATQLTSPSSTVTLNDHNKLPVLGLGVFKAEAGDACKNAVLSALKQGYRHIDTAQIYQNEEAVGQGLKESGLPRDSVFVTSKVWQATFLHICSSRYLPTATSCGSCVGQGNSAGYCGKAVGRAN